MRQRGGAREKSIDCFSDSIVVKPYECFKTFVILFDSKDRQTGSQPVSQSWPRARTSYRNRQIRLFFSSSSSSSSPASWHSSISVSVFAVDTEIFSSISKRCRLSEIFFSCSSQFHRTSGLVESLPDTQSAMAFSLSHTHTRLSLFQVVLLCCYFFYQNISSRAHTHTDSSLSFVYVDCFSNRDWRRRFILSLSLAPALPSNRTHSQYKPISFLFLKIFVLSLSVLGESHLRFENA